MKEGILLLILSFGISNSACSQVNDHCANAILLEAGNQCMPQEYSNANATAEASSVAADPSCGSYVGADVWFKVMMPATGALRVEVDNLAGATPPSFTLYSGGCGNFTELSCVRNDHGKTIYNPVVANEPVYVRIYNYFSSNSSPFLLCIYEPEIPLNDQCENAQLLQVGQACSLVTYSNVYATSQSNSVGPEPPCGFYKGGDVWFKVVMPASGVLRINKNRISGATHPAMAVYSGSCDGFTEEFCSANDPTETISDPSLAGQMLHLRIYSYNNEEGSTFSLCLYEEEAPENDDCENAIILPVGSRCTLANYSNIQATAQPSGIAPVPSCGAYQGGDVWFKVVMPASGALHIETDNASGAVLPSITLYSGSCGSFEEVDCMSNEKARTLFNPALATATLFLRVFKFNSNDGGPFSLCVFEPPVLPNDICENALMLIPGATCVLGSYSDSYASEESNEIASDPSCEPYLGGDVWFKAIIPASGRIRIETKNGTGDTEKAVAIYSGTCGNFKEVMCGLLTPYLLVNEPTLAGSTVYLRVYRYSGLRGGEFSLCIYDPGCITEEVDAGQVTICENESFSFGTRTITAAGEYTELFQTDKGCDSLVTLSVIVNTLETSVVTDGETLTVQSPGASYQWIDCSNGFLPVAGETGQTFKTNSSGEYGVIVTQISCSDTSACYRISVVVGVAGEQKEEHTLFPNPTYQIINIDLHRPYASIVVELIDMKGQIVKTERYAGKSITELDMSTMPSGPYLLRLQTDEGFSTMKLIKE